MSTLGTRSARLAAAGFIAALAAGASGGPAVLAVRPPMDPVAAGSTATVAAAPADADIALQLVAQNLSKPVFLTTAGDGSGRHFIVEQTGKIKILKNGSVSTTPFLNLTTQVSKGYEQGLLGLAFHPSFKSNHRLYVNFTDLNGDTVIREYRTSSTNPNVVATSTARLILKIAQPYDNHNGGMIAFGRDGYLYIGMGDGGDGGDPGNRAQRTDTLLGKMLRIDVNGTSTGKNYRIPSTNPYVGKTGLDAIWQTGLRNPWRWSFDRLTGDLWIGDVGQRAWEEVNRAKQTSAGPGRGINWGWKVLEATHCYAPSSGCITSGKTPPVAEYDHATGRCAVAGGYVYRGRAIPALVGGYVFGDTCSGEIWVVPAGATAPASEVRLLDTSLVISSFGQDGVGELFVLDLNGKVYKIVQG